MSAAESQLASAKASARAAAADAAALRRALDTRAARIAAITLEIEAGTTAGGGSGSTTGSSFDGGEGANSFFEFRAAVAAGLRGASSSPERAAVVATALPKWATSGATAALVSGSLLNSPKTSLEEADAVFRANIVALRAASVYCARLESALATSRAEMDTLSVCRPQGASFDATSSGRQSPSGGASTFRGVSPPKDHDFESFSALKRELAAVNEELAEARAGLREASDQLSESARVLGALLDARSPSPRKR